MLLNYQIFGEKSDHPTLIIAHGLFGSSRNWRAIARQLSRDRQVVTVDMRNHGESFHNEVHDYPSMAEDLASVTRHFGAPCDLLGHSMGGKAAMFLACIEPSLINRLLVIDIAPVRYDHSHLENINALLALELDRITSRSTADEALKASIPDDVVRAFLVQSLVIEEGGNRWMLNLPVLKTAHDDVLGFPEVEGQFTGSALFLSGGQSDYVTSSHNGLILQHFPSTEFEIIAKAGHWVQAEAPREFIEAVSAFIK